MFWGMRRDLNGVETALKNNNRYFLNNHMVSPEITKLKRINQIKPYDTPV